MAYQPAFIECRNKVRLSDNPDKPILFIQDWHVMQPEISHQRHQVDNRKRSRHSLCRFGHNLADNFRLVGVGQGNALHETPQAVAQGAIIIMIAVP